MHASAPGCVYTYAPLEYVYMRECVPSHTAYGDWLWSCSGLEVLPCIRVHTACKVCLSGLTAMPPLPPRYHPATTPLPPRYHPATTLLPPRYHFQVEVRRFLA